MKSKNLTINTRQHVYQKLFIGTLIYTVVLGFFNDYTSVVYAKSFSTIFFAGLILELLTYLTFRIKDFGVGRLGSDRPRALKPLLVWFIMFTSKFVFIWVLDLVFGSYITINGFFGILAVAATATIVQQLAYLGFRTLGKKS